MSSTERDTRQLSNAHTAAAELKRTLKDIITKNPGDLLPAVYLITNRIAPAHAAVELGIGEGIVKKVCPGMPVILPLLHTSLADGSR